MVGQAADVVGDKAIAVASQCDPGSLPDFFHQEVAMHNVERSYERLSNACLRYLSQLVLDKLDEVFARAPVAGLYRDRLILLTLCQGAAQHYVDGRHGIKDLDVWAFFRAGLPKPFPVRSVWNADLGPSRLGRNPSDGGYTGRRIDIMGRSISVDADETPEDAVRSWLTGYSTSAGYLVSRPVIGLFPDALCTRQIWSPRNMLAL